MNEAFDHHAAFNAQRDAYIEILKPIFLPDNPAANDIVLYFSSLLRVFGMEDAGWDPYSESRNILNDLNRLMQMEKPEEDRFPDWLRTQWRLGLTLYSHIVEMDAPYEVITNLLRFRLGKGYEPDPFFLFLNKDEKKKATKYGLGTWKKIEIIQSLSREAGLNVGEMFDDFYRADLRNAIQHSDYVLADDAFRCRNGLSGNKSFRIEFEELDRVLTRAKAFISAVFHLDDSARMVYGQLKGRALPYDPFYKGLIEVLVDDKDMMCGFAVHWPNNSTSIYRRTPNGVQMRNCMLNIAKANVELWVDRYAINKSAFSPLVEEGGEPIYSPLDGTDVRPVWPVA